MSNKKYAFEGRYHKWFKIPVYITFPSIEIEELEDGDKKYTVEGVPELFGRNKFYELILGLVLWVDIKLAALHILYCETFNKPIEPKGFYITLDDIVEVEE